MREKTRGHAAEGRVLWVRKVKTLFTHGTQFYLMCRLEQLITQLLKIKTRSKGETG